MNNIIKRVWNQNRLVNIEDLTGMVFQAESGGHTFEISGIDDTGAAVELSGTVSGVFRRPDNADIALTGSASDGVVSVTLSEDCYAVPGRFGLTIFVTSNSQKVAVYACVGTVAVSSTGNVAGDTPASVEDLIDDINAAIADLNSAIGQIPASYANVMAAIAPTYSGSALYSVGSYAWYNGSLYRCITAITTAETWTAAHWTAAVLGDDVSDLKTHLEDGLGNSIAGTMITGYYIHSSNGGRNSNANFAYCDYMPVAPGKHVRLHHIAVYASQGTAFYGKSKKFISAYSGQTGGDITVDVIVPDDVYYLRASALAANTVIVEYLELYKEHIKPLEEYIPAIQANTRKTSILKQSAVTDIKGLLPFVAGTLSGPSWVVNPDNAYRIATDGLVTAEMDLFVSVPTGFRFGVVIYADGVYTDSGWKTEYTIPNGAQFMMSVDKNPGVASDVIADPFTDPRYTNLSIVPASESDDGWTVQYSDALPLTIEKLNVSTIYSQGACTVRDKILGFKGSANDHSSMNDVYIYDPNNNMALVGTMSHNLGHCATADYSAETNVLITGNGDADTSITPAVWFVKNASGKVLNGGSLLVTDPDVFSIEFPGINGTGCGACFGESSDFIYIITAENPAHPNEYKEKYLYKVMLGKGENDFSGDGYGTYVSGASTNEYNGTAKVVKNYTFEFPGEIQGMKYRNGKLIISTDTSVVHNVLTGYLDIFEVTDDIVLNTVYEMPIYSDGAKISTEAEGVTFYKDRGYITIINSGVGSMLEFPAMML